MGKRQTSLDGGCRTIISCLWMSEINWSIFFGSEYNGMVVTNTEPGLADYAPPSLSLFFLLLFLFYQGCLYWDRKIDIP